MPNEYAIGLVLLGLLTSAGLSLEMGRHHQARRSLLTKPTGLLSAVANFANTAQHQPAAPHHSAAAGGGDTQQHGPRPRVIPPLLMSPSSPTPPPMHPAPAHRSPLAVGNAVILGGLSQALTYSPTMLARQAAQVHQQHYLQQLQHLTPRAETPRSRSTARPDGPSVSRSTAPRTGSETNHESARAGVESPARLPQQLTARLMSTLGVTNQSPRTPSSMSTSTPSLSSGHGGGGVLGGPFRSTRPARAASPGLVGSLRHDEPVGRVQAYRSPNWHEVARHMTPRGSRRSEWATAMAEGLRRRPMEPVEEEPAQEGADSPRDLRTRRNRGDRSEQSERMPRGPSEDERRQEIADDDKIARIHAERRGHEMQFTGRQVASEQRADHHIRDARIIGLALRGMFPRSEHGCFSEPMVGSAEMHRIFRDFDFSKAVEALDLFGFGTNKDFHASNAQQVLRLQLKEVMKRLHSAYEAILPGRREREARNGDWEMDVLVYACYCSNNDKLASIAGGLVAMMPDVGGGDTMMQAVHLAMATRHLAVLAERENVDSDTFNECLREYRDSQAPSFELRRGLNDISYEPEGELSPMPDAA